MEGEDRQENGSCQVQPSSHRWIAFPDILVWNVWSVVGISFSGKVIS
jgi:hypothetical protein